MAEREWREASDMRPSRLGLLLVLAVAAALRFWALGHGIPHAVSVDEPEIVERALRMMRAGTLNPHFFDYGQLLIYIQFFVSVVRFIVGSVTGAWDSLGQVTSDSFYLWGRAVVASFGVATVFVVFRIGLRWGARHALLAAALMALMPLHVRYSHYVLTDVPLTFFVALTMLMALSAHERPVIRSFAVAGAMAGLAAAVKYNGGLALLMPLVACWMTPSARPSRMACMLATVGTAAAAFFITAPFTVLDLPGFLDRFASLTAEYRNGAPPAEAGIIIYLKHLRLQFGMPGMLLITGGLVMGLVRAVGGPGRVAWSVALVFTIPYFLIVADQRIIYARYLLPLVPMLCVLAAAAVISGVSLLRRYQFPRGIRTALIAGLTIALLGPPAVTAVGFDRIIARESTTDLAYRWIVANVPEGSRIVQEGNHLTFARYESHRLRQLRELTYEEHVASGADYLIASSQAYGPYLESPTQFREEFTAYMTLFTRGQEVARFTASDEHPGPELRIVKVRP
ncbi:MAG: glycosyltransferase family 39 protein [Acidobacteriota bacterium]|nr:glycosyltransferase family 39 protein [Acidobacteriota bacterium]